MPGSSTPPGGDPNAPRRTLPTWLLGLAGTGLFLAGGAIGAILALSISLYGVPAGQSPAPPRPPATVAEGSTAVPAAASPAPATPAPSPPTATPIPTGPGVGQEAPPFTLTALDGITHTLAAYRGQTVLLNFWASWCPPCRQEWPELRAFARRTDIRGIIVLSVNVEEPPEVVRDFAGEEPPPFPVLLDGDSGVSDRYRVTALPTTFLIDADGVVRQVIPGNLDAAALERLAGLVPGGP